MEIAFNSDLIIYRPAEVGKSYISNGDKALSDESLKKVTAMKRKTMIFLIK